MGRKNKNKRKVVSKDTVIGLIDDVAPKAPEGNITSILAQMKGSEQLKKKTAAKRKIEEPEAPTVSKPAKKSKGNVKEDGVEKKKKKKKKVVVVEPEPVEESDEEEQEDKEELIDSDQIEEIVEEEEEEEMEGEQVSDLDDEDEDEEDSDEDDEDEEEEEGEETEMINEDTGESLEFDFEAFPMEEGDRDGIIHMLTQIFLRADVDCRGLAETLIEQSPFGSVVGPSESCADDVAENVVYGLLTAIKVDSTQDKKFVKDVVDLLTARLKKNATKEVLRKFEEALKSPFLWLINERMLRFPSQIAPPCFASLQQDVAGLKEPVENVVYIQKLRIADAEKAADSVPAPSKRKLGKAAKKRLALEKIAEADIRYDNAEDALLMNLPQGTATFFDYNVAGEVEPGSKFHVQTIDGKQYRPYRRVILMDKARLDAFIEAVKNF